VNRQGFISSSAIVKGAEGSYWRWTAAKNLCRYEPAFSHRWMTGMRFGEMDEVGKTSLAAFAARVTIDPLSILCPSRGRSTSPEKHLDIGHTSFSS
jgi:hypothetical protein